jgi:hypothetical protein
VADPPNTPKTDLSTPSTSAWLPPYQVADFEHVTEPYGQTSETVWNFTLKRFDTSGDLVQAVPVQMRASIFDGAIHDGTLIDHLELAHAWRPGETVKAWRVHVQDTEVWVTAKGGWRNFLLHDKDLF